MSSETKIKPIPAWLKCLVKCYIKANDNFWRDPDNAFLRCLEERRIRREKKLEKKKAKYKKVKRKIGDTWISFNKKNKSK